MEALIRDGLLSTNMDQALIGLGSVIASYLGSEAKKQAPAIARSLIDKATRRVEKVPKKRKRSKTPMACSSLKQVCKEVRKLKSFAESGMGNLIYRSRITARVLNGTVNTAAYDNYVCFDISSMETALAELRFFDPAAPGTLVQGSGASGAYQRNYLFEKMNVKLTVKNNYQVPCKFAIYLCEAKEDTSIAAATAFTNGLTDVGNPSATSCLILPPDSVQLTELYKVTYKKGGLLLPGQQVSTSYSGSNIEYDPAMVDSHNLSYQSRYRGANWIVRVEGVLGHDTTADEQGSMLAGLDIQRDREYSIKYDAGVDLKYIVVADSSDSFSNAGVNSEQPVADNVAYSAS